MQINETENGFTTKAEDGTLKEHSKLVDLVDYIWNYYEDKILEKNIE
jgi:hypothetical protein